MDALRGLVLSEARAKVLTALFSERGRAFYQKELARATGLPIVAVQRQLKRLIAAGLGTAATAGGGGGYSARPPAAVISQGSAVPPQPQGPPTSLPAAPLSPQGQS